jgi:hypothetical protein
MGKVQVLSLRIRFKEIFEVNIEYEILRINFEICLKAKFKTIDKS